MQSPRMGIQIPLRARGGGACAALRWAGGDPEVWPLSVPRAGTCPKALPLGSKLLPSRGLGSSRTSGFRNISSALTCNPPTAFSRTTPGLQVFPSLLSLERCAASCPVSACAKVKKTPLACLFPAPTERMVYPPLSETHGRTATLCTNS